MNGSLPPANPSPAQKCWPQGALLAASSPRAWFRNGKMANPPPRAVSLPLVSVLERKRQGVSSGVSALQCISVCTEDRVGQHHRQQTQSPTLIVSQHLGTTAPSRSPRSRQSSGRAHTARVKEPLPEPRSPLDAGAARSTHPARSRGSGAAAGPWPGARGPAAASPGAAARSCPSFVLVSP